MKLIPRPDGRTRLKIFIPSVAVRRRVVAVIVAADFFLIVVAAVRALVFHVGTPYAALVALALGAICGPRYLRSTRGRS